MEILSYLPKVVEQSSFFSSFYSNLAAALIIAALFSIIYPRIQQALLRPKLQLLVGKKARKNVELTVAKDGNWEATLTLIIKNNGSATLRDVYYALFFPVVLKPQLPNRLSDDATIQATPLLGSNWVKIHGIIRSPIYPKRLLTFPFQIKVKTEPTSISDWVMLYFFSTEYGMYPRGAEALNELHKQAILEAKLGGIKIFPPTPTNPKPS